MLVYAILVMFVAGLLLGLILGVAAEKLVVESDPLLEIVTELLPGYNCGGCGYPGCENFAKGLVDGEVSKISICRPSSQKQREAIKEIFDKTPRKDGDLVNVTI